MYIASGIDRHPDRKKFISDCRYRVIESSSLVPVLFREVFSHPYISFFHLLVNGFSVIYIYIFINTITLKFHKVEVFSVVMKTHNCLRRTYVSLPRIDAHAFQSRAQ